MSAVYQSLTFEKAPIWERVPVGAIDRFHWETATPYRPQSFFQLCFVKEKGVFVRLWTDETDCALSAKSATTPYGRTAVSNASFSRARAAATLTWR